MKYLNKFNESEDLHAIKANLDKLSDKALNYSKNKESEFKYALEEITEVGDFEISVRTDRNTNGYSPDYQSADYTYKYDIQLYYRGVLSGKDFISKQIEILPYILKYLKKLEAEGYTATSQQKSSHGSNGTGNCEIDFSIRVYEDNTIEL